jgi:hypothetical protein
VSLFNFITASRIENPVLINLRGHFIDFLQNIKNYEKLLDFAIPVIASSLLLDSHPPDMHCKSSMLPKHWLIVLAVFSPLEIFRTLYKEICHQVCRLGVLAHERSINMILPSGFIRCVETEFVKQVEAFSRLPDLSSAIWHQKNLYKFKHEWITMRSKDTCFACLGERPQYCLPCGHLVCEICIRRFGAKKDAWTFNVHLCFLCESETPGIHIKVKPPTASVRLLSIDVLGGSEAGNKALQYTCHYNVQSSSRRLRNPWSNSAPKKDNPPLPITH